MKDPATNSIKNYKPKQAVIDDFANSNFVVIAGPAAAGKDTLRDGLLYEYEGTYRSIISVTTRESRADEVEGKTYHFITDEKMKQMIENQSLLQVALVHSQQISALDSSELKKLGVNKTGLSILVVQTELELYKINPKIKTIFLIPPSYQELIKRLELERLTKHHEINRRLKAAIAELEIALRTNRYLCIVSDEKGRVIKLAHEFLKNDVFDEREDNQARMIMRKILEDLKQSKVS